MSSSQLHTGHMGWDGGTGKQLLVLKPELPITKPNWTLGATLRRLAMHGIRPYPQLLDEMSQSQTAQLC
mgnify:FL=1